MYQLYTAAGKLLIDNASLEVVTNIVEMIQDYFDELEIRKIEEA